ncbi:MAG: hypothetical protein NNA23_06555 [Nitrospira sp.]|nr:hypothetical protein [Nitrospira sp.]MCP9463474.1 hypothetical protein [Nitrospira sp.]
MTSDSSPPQLHPEPETVSFIRRPEVRMIIYAGLGLFTLMAVVWPMVTPLLDPDFKRHIAEHRVMVGMTKEQVLEAWGGPQTIHTSFTKDGIRHEEWIFEDWVDAATVRHRYLYFEEGILVGGWYQGSRERSAQHLPSGKPKSKSES